MSDANKYVVEKRVGDSDWEVVGTVEGVKTFRVSDLTPDTSYDFRVKGVNVIDGEEYSGEYSDVVSVRTLSSIDVAVPTGLSVSMQWDRAVLTWDSVAGATGYELQYKSLNEPDWVSLSRTDLLTQTVSSLSEGVSYSFRLRAVVVYDVYTFYSDWTDAVEGVTLVQVPSVPLDLVGYPYGDYIDISWGVSSLATRYVLEYKIQDGQFSELYSGTDFSYRHSGLTVDTDYFYRVKAVREINGIVSESDFSSEVQVNTGQIRLAVPSGFLLTSSDYTSADFSWEAVPSAVSYEVSYLKGESDEFVVAGTFEGTTAKVSGLSDGYSYKFRIRSVGAGDLFSDYSELLDVSLPLYMLNSISVNSEYKVGDLVASNPFEYVPGSGVLVLLFNLDVVEDMQYIDKYQVRIKKGDDVVENLELNSDIVSEVEGVALGMIPFQNYLVNTEYSFDVRSMREVNGSVYYSDYSIEYVFTSPAIMPKSPDYHTYIFTVEGDTVSMQWDSVQYASGYEVQYALYADRVWGDSIKTETNSVSVSLEYQTRYLFQVRSYRNLDGGDVFYSDWSVMSGFVETEGSDWTYVSGFQLSRDDSEKTVTFSWNPVKEADGYCIYYNSYAKINPSESSKLVENWSKRYTYSGKGVGSKVISPYDFGTYDSYGGRIRPYQLNSKSFLFNRVVINLGATRGGLIENTLYLGKVLFNSTEGVIDLGVSGSASSVNGLYNGINFSASLGSVDSLISGELSNVFDMRSSDTFMSFKNLGLINIRFDTESGVSFDSIGFYLGTNYPGYLGTDNFFNNEDCTVSFYLNETLIDVLFFEDVKTSEEARMDFVGRIYGQYSEFSSVY